MLLRQEKYRNFDFYFIAPNKESLRFCNYENITVRNLNLTVSSKTDLIKNLFTLKRFLNEIKPDLVHCNCITPDSMMVYLRNLISLKKNKIHGQLHMGVI